MWKNSYVRRFWGCEKKAERRAFAEQGRSNTSKSSLERSIAKQTGAT